ncbi:MAG: ABC transporter ATP-binding protein [Patescibacteria group bacterium]|nr:ABC transporter ATP-binding protein [Patescibacteria group bacterium]
MTNYSKETFKIYYQSLKKYKRSVFLVLFSVIIAPLGNIITPLFYRDFFNVLADWQTIDDPASQLKFILLKILIVYLISWLFWRLATFAAAYFQSMAVKDIYDQCFAYLHKHSISFFNNSFVGTLVKRVNRFTHSFVGISDLLIWDVIPLLVNISLIIIILSQRDLFLGLGILAWLILYIAITYAFSIYKLKFDLKRAEANSRLTGVLADTISNQLNVKLFNGYQREIKYFGGVNSNLQKLRLFTWKLDNIFEAVQGFLTVFLEVGIFYLAISLWQKGVITLGDFVLIQVYVINVFMRMWHFGRIIRRYYEYMADANEMTEVLTTAHEIVDSKKAKELQISKGEIEFKGVDFSYNKTRMVIKDFNLRVLPKEKVAIVGASGSGKSTLVNLLLRNYDLTKGKILLDGQPINKVKQESLWANIALVNQDPILFHRTLKENIKYGRPEATDEEVIKAAKLANAHDFILEFSDLYNTYVGERGVKLSGGERQRVAIARAILKNAPILVLDEATSSLDSESEGLIQDALANLMKNKTVIVIAHRLSTIMKMDRIVVLDSGQIVEQGNHQELINKKGGLYKKLWEKQVGGFIA